MKADLYSNTFTGQDGDKTHRTTEDVSLVSTRSLYGSTEKGLIKDEGHSTESNIKTFDTSQIKDPIGYAMSLGEQIIKEINKTLTDEFSQAKESKSNITKLENYATDDQDPQLLSTEADISIYGDDALHEEKESVTTMDPVDEEIKRVLDYLPKLPEVASLGNNTHFDYRKEDQLDERITQVARQLAETSLRREYEEKKLGHFIPIRLRQFDEQISYSSYPPARQISTGKSLTAPSVLDLFVKIPRTSQISFKPLTLPEHIYNGPFFIPTVLSPGSSTEEEILQSEPVFVTEADDKPKQEIDTTLSRLTNIGTILQLGPRYVVPTALNTIRQNRIPFFLDLNPREYSSYTSENDLRTTYVDIHTEN